MRCWSYSHFNPRPPRGGRRLYCGGHPVRPVISIHAPREGGDWQSAETPDSINIFQSTPPARGATRNDHRWAVRHRFQSTPPARGATACGQNPCFPAGFQSTPPARGATQCFQMHRLPQPEFQSTPPARGATFFLANALIENLISIHAPREGGDNNHNNSRKNGKISIHAPREGGDHEVFYRYQMSDYFNPRPPRGGRLRIPALRLASSPHFNPRPPRGGRLLHFVDRVQTEKFQSTPPARGATKSG